MGVLKWEKLVLFREDPLEKGISAHSCILAWRITWQKSLVGYSPWGHRELDTTEQLTLSPFFFPQKLGVAFADKVTFGLGLKASVSLREGTRPLHKQNHGIMKMVGMFGKC